MAFFEGALGRNAVYLLGVERDIETVGPDNVVLLRDELAVVVMQLPGELYQPGPVVEVR
jgi:hypothetical protein